jgi:cytochrome c peroxidase
VRPLPGTGLAALALAALPFLGVALLAGASLQGGYVVQVPPHFPAVPVPADAPLTEACVQLGRRLFYDRRLSASGNTSCASCHQQALAFTDGRARAVGDSGEQHARSAPSLANVAWASRLGWANPLQHRLEQQARVPMFGEDPVEMGLSAHPEQALARLQQDPRLAEGFRAAFGLAPAQVGWAEVTRAIACFERTLVSGDAPFDRWQRGDQTAVTDPAKRGHALFTSERLECFHCHGGFNFTDATGHAGQRATDATPFHNTGLYALGADGLYPARDPGVAAVTRDRADDGRFKAPTLRNVAVTAPYMHDGSIATLSEVLDHYAAGGRVLHGGPDAGDGSTNPRKSPFVSGFVLSAEEKRDLLAFLGSLTDQGFLVDPRFGDPDAAAPALASGGLR